MCDDDQNWVTPPEEKFPGVDKLAEGNRPWYDPVADVMFHRGVPNSNNKKTQEPGCKGHDGQTRAQTYCDAPPLDMTRVNGQFCRITLCNQFLPGTTDQKITTFSFDQIPMGTDFSKRKLVRKPLVDDFKMLSVTILHEWMHTVYVENKLEYIDVASPKSYGWKNIVRMGKSGLKNADSLAYIGQFDLRLLEYTS